MARREVVELAIRAAYENTQALTKAIAQLEGLEDVAGEAGAEAKRLAADLDRLSNQDRLAAAFSKTRDQLSRTDTALASARTKATELGRQLATTAQPTAEMQRAFERARASVRKLTDDQDRQRSELSRLNRELRETGFNTSRFEQSQRLVAVRLRATNNEITPTVAKLRELHAQTSKQLADPTPRARRGLADLRAQASRPIPDPTTPMRVGANATARSVGLLREAIGLLGGVQILRGFISANQSVDVFETTLTRTTGSAQEARFELERLRGEAERLGLDFVETTGDYLKFLAAAERTPFAGEQASKIFFDIAAGLGGIGKTGPEANRAFNALIQILSKGKVQAEELRGQLGDVLPGAFSIFAEAAGVSESALDKLLETGQVGIDVLPKFAQLVGEAYGPAQTERVDNLQASLNRLRNEINLLFEDAGRAGLAEGLSTAISALREGITETAEFARNVGTLSAGAVDAISLLFGQLGRGRLTLDEFNAAAVDIFKNISIGLEDNARLAGDLPDEIAKSEPALDAVETKAKDAGKALRDAFDREYNFGDLNADQAFALVNELDAKLAALGRTAAEKRSLGELDAQQTLDTADTVLSRLGALRFRASRPLPLGELEAESVVRSFDAIETTLNRLQTAAKAKIDIPPVERQQFVASIDALSNRLKQLRDEAENPARLTIDGAAQVDAEVRQVQESLNGLLRTARTQLQLDVAVDDTPIKQLQASIESLRREAAGSITLADANATDLTSTLSSVRGQIDETFRALEAATDLPAPATEAFVGSLRAIQSRVDDFQARLASGGRLGALEVSDVLEQIDKVQSLIDGLRQSAAAQPIRLGVDSQQALGEVSTVEARLATLRQTASQAIRLAAIDTGDANDRISDVAANVSALRAAVAQDTSLAAPDRERFLRVIDGAYGAVAQLHAKMVEGVVISPADDAALRRQLEALTGVAVEFQNRIRTPGQIRVDATPAVNAFDEIVDQFGRVQSALAEKGRLSPPDREAFVEVIQAALAEVASLTDRVGASTELAEPDRTRYRQALDAAGTEYRALLDQLAQGGELGQADLARFLESMRRARAELAAVQAFAQTPTPLNVVVNDDQIQAIRATLAELKQEYEEALAAGDTQRATDAHLALIAAINENRDALQGLSAAQSAAEASADQATESVRAQAQEFLSAVDSAQVLIETMAELYRAGDVNGAERLAFTKRLNELLAEEREEREKTAEKAREQTAAQKDVTEETEKTTEAAGGMAAAFSFLVDSLGEMSGAAQDALDGIRQMPRPVADTSEEAARLQAELGRISERIQENATRLRTSDANLSAFLNRVNDIKEGFYEQALQVQRTTDQIRAMRESGEVDMGLLNRATALARNGLDLLDNVQLDGLRGEIAQVRRELAELRREAIETAEEMQRRLLRARGEDVALAELDANRELADLQAQLARAQAARDQEAIAALEEAIRARREILDIELATIRAREAEDKRRDNLQAADDLARLSVDAARQRAELADQQGDPTALARFEASQQNNATVRAQQQALQLGARDLVAQFAENRRLQAQLHEERLQQQRQESAEKRELADGDAEHEKRRVREVADYAQNVYGSIRIGNPFGGGDFRSLGDPSALAQLIAPHLDQMQRRRTRLN